MIDPENGLLTVRAGHRRQQRVERDRAIEVVAKRLLEHDPATGRQFGRAERSDCRREHSGRQRQIGGNRLIRAIRHGIGRSFQITNLFPSLTAFENARLAAQALSRRRFRLFGRASALSEPARRAAAAIELVGLSEQANTPAAALSHGDKRRLELAMLVAPDPELLMLDEPTAGMASEQVPQLLDVIARIRADAGKTLLLVEHRMDVVMSVSDRITVMHNGAVLAEDAPQAIAADPRVQQAYLGELYDDVLRQEASDGADS